MVRGLVLCSIVAGLLVAAPASARVADHNPLGVPDATGDSGTAPDITRFTLANTASGDILFVVQVANRTELVANDIVAISIDSDRNGSTGDPNGDGGIDHVIVIHGTDRIIVLLRWSGTTFEPVQATTLQGTFSGGYVAIVNRSDLGNTSAMDVFAETALIEGPEDSDAAPDGVYQEYTLSAPHVKSITPRWAPAAPRAGAAFRLTAVQLAFETDERGTAASFACRATLGGRAVRGTGAGRCTFRLPRAAKGKQLVITITATPPNGKAQTFRAYRFRVR